MIRRFLPSNLGGIFLRIPGTKSQSELYNEWKDKKGGGKAVKLPLSVLAEQYADSVYAVAFSVCRNIHDAQDIMQDTFLEYHLTNKDYTSQEHIHAWLLRVAINKSRNLCRSAQHRHTLPLEDWAQTLVFPEPVDRQVLEAVMALPEQHRVVVHLYYYEGYSVKEIAKLLRVGESAVKHRLAGGRAKLKELLKEDWNNDES